MGGAGGKAKFHVFLMIGQSNMEGYGVLEDEDFVAPARVLKMSPTKTWLPGNEGTNISRQNRKRGEVGTSMGRTFAMELLNNESDPEVKIGLINVAVGGSSIQSWQDPPPDPPAGRTPYDANYAKMLPFLREALKTGVLKGVLWHQGEANGGGGESYEAYLRKLISNLRAEVNDPNLPFMLGQVGLETETRGVNLSLANVAMSDPRVGLATNEGLTMKPGENNPHYDARSQREYGRRYARIYRSLTAAP